jgi:hypothetical protein
MAFSRIGLFLQRTQLATHLSLKVLQSGHIGFSRRKPPFCSFLPSTKLEYPSRLFDNHPTVFWTRVENLVYLPLRHYHVLLTANPGVTQKVLDIE